MPFIYDSILGKQIEPRAAVNHAKLAPKMRLKKIQSVIATAHGPM
jgi:hypothetical protein